MGKNRSGAAVLVWLCTEEGWNLEEAVEHLRDINPLACANPHLLYGLAAMLDVGNEVPLVPSGDGGGWICISPPGSPRQGGVEAFEDSARDALDSLAGLAAQRLAEEGEEEEAEEHAGDGDCGALFDGI